MVCKKFMLDLINSIYAYVFIFMLFMVFKIPAKYFLAILAHLLLVFLTNGVLFPAEYMPDQFRYIHSASSIRDSGFDLSAYIDFDENRALNVSNAGLFFSLFPIPFLDSIYSISVINFMLFSLVFIYLYKKRVLTGYSIWLYLLFPSLALYSAIASRDILVFVVMIISFYQAYRGNTIISIILATPLLLIKAQNFIIYLVSLMAYLVLKKYHHKQFLQFILMLGFAFSCLVFLLTFIQIDALNIVRMNMFLEDGGIVSEYNPLNSWQDVFRYGFTGIFYTFLYPLPWEVNGPLQLIQFFENIIIFVIIVWLSKRLIKLDNDVKYLLFSYLISHAAIYGLVISNYGTLARYKFSFILIFLLFAIKLLYDEALKLNHRGNF